MVTLDKKLEKARNRKKGPIKLRWLKNWEIRKVGDVSNVAKKSAENFVSQGYAEYVETDDKPKNKGIDIVEELEKARNRKRENDDDQVELLINNNGTALQIVLTVKEREAKKAMAKSFLSEIETKDYSFKSWLEHTDKWVDCRNYLAFEFWKEHWEEFGVEEEEKNPGAIFGVSGQVERFYELQPFFYDKAGMFFCWDEEMKKYDMVDDVDMLNGVAGLGVDTISSKSKTEITNALKQFGRKKIPKPAPKTWVQYKDKIFDYKNDEEFEASPEYFITNPIPHKLGKSEETPMIDKLFLEWVGEDYKETLEQITSYSASSDQFMQRLFAAVGGGSNGKGTYLKLLMRFLGQDNSASSEVKELSSNQFETAVIYKKLLCVVGEVSYDDLKNTNQLKKLGGEDPIRYCFKGKTPFTEESPTTLIANTNSMPKTPDKTMGFYRKWLIVDFPNQFSKIKKGIIENIPEEEFENLAKKSLRILKELYKTRKFTNEGSFQERMDRYEERSNPVGKFLEIACEEVAGVNLELRTFSNHFNRYAKRNHLRILSVRQIGAILREDGFQVGARTRKKADGTKESSVVIVNLTLKTIETIKTIEDQSRIIRGKSMRDLDSFGSFDSFSNKQEAKNQKYTKYTKYTKKFY